MPAGSFSGGYIYQSFIPNSDCFPVIPSGDIVGLIWDGLDVKYVYLLVFCELSEIEQDEFILESGEIERIFGITLYPREFIFLPA